MTPQAYGGALASDPLLLLPATAFAPTRGVGVFVAINKFDFAAAMAMAGAVNELIAHLAPC